MSRTIGIWMLWAVFIYAALNAAVNAFALINGVDYQTATIRGLDAPWLEKYGQLHVALLMFSNIGIALAVLFQRYSLGVLSAFSNSALITVEAFLIWRSLGYGNAIPESMLFFFYGFWIVRILLSIFSLLLFLCVKPVATKGMPA